MLRFLLVFICFNFVCGYFTLPGKCPERGNLQEEFRLADFFGKWYQAYHYSSDGQNNNNCSVLELMNSPTGIYLNQSKVDLGRFHRYSIARVEIPGRIEDGAALELTFVFENAARRLVTRRYPFWILATNYNQYATVYTCQYSALIDKHYVYVWLLSRHQILNDVSKELAIKPLERLGVTSKHLIKDDNSKCLPHYFEDPEVEPSTFRYPVPI